MSEEQSPKEGNDAASAADSGKTEEQLKAERIARGRANLLPPAKKGEVRNPSGKNGRTQHAALIRWLEEADPNDPQEKRSRILRVWEATFEAAVLEGSAPDRKLIVEQYGGKPRQQVDLSNEDESLFPAVLRVIASAAKDQQAEPQPQPEAPRDGGH